MPTHYGERHHRFDLDRWPRAAVLGANDGIVSAASLVLGVAGALAMAITAAVGEFFGTVA